MLDRNTDFGQRGIGQARIKPATAFDHQADDRTRGRIKKPGFDEDRVHSRLEQRVIDDVVQVAVSVVVAPACRQAHEPGEGLPGGGPWRSGSAAMTTFR